MNKTLTLTLMMNDFIILIQYNTQNNKNHISNTKLKIFLTVAPSRKEQPFFLCNFQATRLFCEDGEEYGS